MNLSNNEAKMKIVERLVKEGHVDFVEALELLKVEDNFNVPYYPMQIIPYSQPYNPWWSTENPITTWEITTN